MNQLISQINSKPYHIRRRWLIGMTAGATLLMIAIWVITVKSAINANNPDQTATPQTASSIDSLGSKIKEAWAAMKEGISGTMNEFEKISTSTALESTNSSNSVSNAAGPSSQP